MELPHSDILAIVCGHHLLHSNSQAGDGRSTAFRDAVYECIFCDSPSFLPFDDAVGFLGGSWCWAIIHDTP